MRIENPPLTNMRVDGRQGMSALHAPVSSSPPAAANPEASSHARAPELVEWVTQVRALQEVRDDRVREVAQRLAGGAYFTGAAAEQTAEVILDG